MIYKVLVNFIIIIHFLMPFHEKEYRYVKSYYLNDQGTVYIIILEDLSSLRLPAAFTTIEEK